MSESPSYRRLSPREQRILEANKKRAAKIDSGETKQDPKKKQWERRRKRDW